MTMMKNYAVIIIGAGAAGLMCAIEAGKRGRRVLVLDHAKKLAEKIRISGGGRCNFTNIYTHPNCFLSQNPHFCKSALKQYTAHDFIALVEKHNIAYHEKKLGQLFCDQSAQQIIDMLFNECKDANVTIQQDTSIQSVTETKDGFQFETSKGTYTSQSLVIATGGLSIPKIGATGFGYDLARQFNIPVIDTRAGLVPLTFTDDILLRCKTLSGVSIDADITYQKTSFAEGFLFTHRGLSGPSILQISSYWKEGDAITVNMAPGVDVLTHLKDEKENNPKQDMTTSLSKILPKRLAQMICDDMSCTHVLAETSNKTLQAVADHINHWSVKPAGTEGYRTAEVTLGGVDTDYLSSKTMAVKDKANLFFIGEVVDVTGHLGGFNFQWAWSSGYVAGQYA